MLALEFSKSLKTTNFFNFFFFFFPFLHNDITSFFSITGYGFVDFDNPNSAQRAVSALQSKGIQAQMAKVRKLKFFVLQLFLKEIHWQVQYFL